MNSDTFPKTTKELGEQLISAAIKQFGHWIYKDSRGNEKTIDLSFHGMPFKAKGFGVGNNDAFAVIVWYAKDRDTKTWVNYDSKDFTADTPDKWNNRVSDQQLWFVRGVMAASTESWPEQI